VLSSLLLATLLAAQAHPEVEIMAEPHHHPALANPYARGFKGEVRPGQATLMHRHCHDYVYVVLGAAEISNQVEGKPPVNRKLQEGETESLDGGLAQGPRSGLDALPQRDHRVAAGRAGA
jgi:hypothetical protein